LKGGHRPSPKIVMRLQSIKLKRAKNQTMLVCSMPARAREGIAPLSVFGKQSWRRSKPSLKKPGVPGSTRPLCDTALKKRRLRAMDGQGSLRARGDFGENQRWNLAIKNGPCRSGRPSSNTCLDGWWPPSRITPEFSSKPYHLREQLVEGAWLTPHRCRRRFTGGRADGQPQIDLINENDAKEAFFPGALNRQMRVTRPGPKQPTNNLRTNSEAVPSRKKGPPRHRPASPLPQQRLLPVPGGPYQADTPLGILRRWR